MRLFLALDLDAPARAALDSATRGFRTALTAVAGALRWTAPENFHVTLHFLGEVAPAALESVQQALAPALVVPPAPVAFTALGTLPRRGSPRVLHLAPATDVPWLRDVYEQLGQRLVSVGMAYDLRFTPHITLARVRSPSRAVETALAPIVAAGPIAGVSWRPDAVILYASDLSGRVPRYTRQLRIGLEA